MVGTYLEAETTFQVGSESIAPDLFEMVSGTKTDVKHILHVWCRQRLRVSDAARHAALAGACLPTRHGLQEQYALADS